MDRPKMILALDFGGTKLAAGVWDADTERFVAMDRCPSPVPLGAEASLERMLALADEQMKRVGAVPVAVGVSFDGPLDPCSGRPIASYHVPGWEIIDLSARIEDRFGVPCVIENDANAATLGEGLYGAGRGLHSMLYMTISTGIGGGLFLGGELYRGVRGLAGEIGHMCVERDGPLCACGRYGCLEALGAGPAIERMYHKELFLAYGPRWPEHTEPLSAEQISQAARQGERMATDVMHRAASYVGEAIGSVLNLLNLERVVLGGGVTHSGSIYWNALRNAADERVMPGIRANIVPAQLRGEAPLWGVSFLAKERIG